MGSLRRIAVFSAISILIFVLIGTGTVYASNQSLPGDLLYPVKLDVEKMQLFITHSNEKVDLGIRLMHKRNQEINQLIELGRYDDLNLALQDLESLSGAAVQQYDLLNNQQHPAADHQGNMLDEAIENNISVLNRVLTQVPPQAQVAIGKVIENAKRDNSIVEKHLLDPTGPGEGGSHVVSTPQHSSDTATPTSGDTTTPSPNNTATSGHPADNGHPVKKSPNPPGNPHSTPTQGQGSSPGNPQSKPTKSNPHNKP
ncbi:MAG: DUF5667 domain-containing protein [Anaerolineaceae bacterium]|nr:DUF5667 domain-containing protein [Anaerolineaceae bacterium]